MVWHLLTPFHNVPTSAVRCAQERPEHNMKKQAVDRVSAHVP